MTTPLPVGPLSPYITPSVLGELPTGISWSSIVPGPVRNPMPAQVTAVQADLCAIATSMADRYCRQPLRATIDTLPLTGPGPRVYVPRDCSKPAKLIMTRWPVLSVVSVQVSRNTFPRSWTPVPAGSYEPAVPVSGLYGSVAPTSAGEGGQGIWLAPGHLDWRYGRDGWITETQYVNGWPHAGATSAAAEGATSLQVDDCTGWAVISAYGGVTGATGTLYDAGSQEVVHVTAASALAGPGTLTLAQPLLYPHSAGVMVSALPADVIWACALFAASVAVTRGATATTQKTIPGEAASTEGPKTPPGLAAQARALLDGLRRII